MSSHRRQPDSSSPAATLTRRRFLTIVAALPGVGIGGLGWQLASAAPPAWLLGLLDDPAAAARFGAAYLDDHPEERDAERLAALIDASVTELGGRTGAGPDGLDGLDAAVRGDYATGETLRVRDWLLSRTEARLYALAAVVAG